MRYERQKIASVLANLHKRAEAQKKKKKNYDLPLYGDAALAGFLAPMGVVGGSNFANALAHEYRNSAVDRFNARVKRITRRLAMNEDALTLRQIMNEQPLTIGYSNRGLKKLEHKINKMNRRLAIVDSKTIPRAKRVGGAIGGITMALPAVLLFKKHLDQKKRETGRYF